MPFGSEDVEPGVGLALSGGGFRATLFHCGALWRLNELGLLRTLARVSSVSGGSITAGLLALRWGQLQWGPGNVAGNLESLLIDPLRAFCRRDVDVPTLGEGLLRPFTRTSELLEREYRRHLLGAATLRDLSAEPRFVINATNLATGVSFRFSKPYAGDYRIGLMRDPAFPVALAVAASSAFPPFLSPVVIEPDPASFERVQGADLYDQAGYRRRLLLTDGGVYDNLGLETVWTRYDTVLVSDAGAPFDLDVDPESAWHNQVLRALDVATNQSRGLRKRALVADYRAGVRKGAYWGIATDIREYGVPDALPVLPGRITALAAVRTRLNAFSDEEQAQLINWGYAVCDAALRRTEPPPPPGVPLPMPVPRVQWPVPAFPLDR
jgi:NTE family protein